jgi:hypothetical protein
MNSNTLLQEDASIVFPNNPSQCEREEVDLSYLFHYIQSRFEIKKLGFKLQNTDSKTFFKLRHNCFKSYFLYLLGLPNVEERPFTNFGIDSNRTPDFLMELPQGFLLIEFTVVLRFSTALKTKASLLKYNPEIAKLRSKGHVVHDFYAVLSLDSDTSGLVSLINDISSKFGLNLNDNPDPTISMLKERFEYLNYHISQMMPELLSNTDYDLKNPLNINPKVEFVDLNFKSYTNIVSIKRFKQQHVLSSLWGNIQKLEREIKFKKQGGKYKIFCNVRNNNAFIDLDDEGISKNTLMSLIQGRSLELINWTDVSGSFNDVEEPFNIYGDVSLEGNFQRSKFSELIFDTSAYLELLKKRYNTAEGVSLIGDKLLDSQVDSVEDLYLDLLSKKNNIKTDNVIAQNKDCFMFPISLGLIMGNYKCLKIKTKLTLTNFLIAKVKDVKFTEKRIIRDMDFDNLNRVSQDLVKVQNDLNRLVDPNTFRKLKNISNLKFLDKLVDEFNLVISDEIRDICSNIVKLKGDYSKNLGESTRTTYKNKITLSQGYLKSNWFNEMEHFNQEKGKIKVAKNLEYNELLLKFQSLIEILFSQRSDKCPDHIYSQTEAVGINLKRTCEDMKKLLNQLEDSYLRTELSHNLLMISRVFYSVLYYSNIKSNKNDFYFDNCGYENLLLFVKGGKKIISTKKSRLFKLIIPINSKIAWIYKSKFTEIVRSSNGSMFCVFPWRSFKFEMLKKAIELPYSFGNYYISSRLESGLTDNEFDKFVSIKVLNMFSQRRKVEIWFGNLRYIYFNSLGTHTNVTKLIGDMVDYDYDPYMFLIQRMFLKNYKSLVNTVKEGQIFDLFSQTCFNNFDLCAEKFDESIFMTKAPFEPTNEHLKNLRSVLSVHKEYCDKFSIDPISMFNETSCDANDSSYIQDLFSDDFKFDPKLCFMIGQFLSKKFESLTTSNDLSQKFSNILSESFTNIKTSKGMRSDTGQFWGKKGFDVVFTDKKYKDFITQFLNNPPETRSEFNKVTYDIHESFSQKIMDVIDEKSHLYFDIKDKDQYKGSREVYVMSENTKLLQQPLEKFFKELCRLTPNEIINKKSHVRPKLIHSKVYEYTGQDALTYCTLDCRKWAPKSNLWKYFYFVKGMSQFLPSEFMLYFERFWSMMFFKKVKIQKRFVDLLEKNSNTRDLLSDLSLTAEGDSEFIMPYSFMMGIFNYLSSLFHAASQLYFDEVISEPMGVSFKLLAHSDDSGGVIISKSYEKNIKLFKMYECFQKGNNHLFSDKKCSLSNHSFELISIMYNNKRLIPMTHKFLANISFEPKGSGWTQDISTIVSKVVEIYSNGGTYLQLYSTMLSTSEMIRKFYHLERLTVQSKIPLSFGGTFDMHPIHLILLGADAQEIMLDLIESPEQRDFRIATYKIVCGDYVIGKGGSPNYKIPLHKRHANTLEITELEKELLNVLSLVKTKTTFDDIVMYFSSLYQSSFTFSLMGIDMPKIFTSTLYSKIGVYNFDGKKMAHLKDLNHMYSAGILLNEEKIETGYYDFSNYHQYMKASESIYFKLDSFDIQSNKTCKPLTYNTFMNLGLNLNFETVSELVAYNRSDYIKSIHKNPRKMDVLTSWVNNIIPGEGKQKLEVLKSLERKDLEKVRSAYMFFPSGIAIDTIERFWTYSILYTTRRYLISSVKPQFFTIENFSGWSSSYENLKHYYLILKLMNNINLNESTIDKLKNNAKCKACVGTEGMLNMIDEYAKIKKLQLYDEMTTNLPFAVYKTPQKRSTNIWFGSGDFEIHTQFGSVRHEVYEGDALTTWFVEDEAYLDQLWYLYQTFCRTRGIFYESPSYGYNYSPDIKLGFNDLDVPFFVGSYFTGLHLSHSKVSLIEVPTRLLRNLNNKITYLDEVCDFELYYSYDINQGFFEEHKLNDISDLMFEKEFTFSFRDVVDNFGSSKGYKLLQNDESQSSFAKFEDKYVNNGFLGSNCSLSRALAISDNIGETRYKSSVNPTLLDQGIFSSQTVRDVPVLDLFNACNFTRTTFLEQTILAKIANQEGITDNEKMIIGQIKEKMGLEGLGIALTLFRDVFRNLSGSDLVKVDPKRISEVIENLVEVISNAMEINPKLKYKYQTNLRKDAFWNNLYFMLKVGSDLTSLSNFLMLGLIRAHNDNPKAAWETRRKNVFSSVMNFSNKTNSNCQVFIRAALQGLKAKHKQVYYDLINKLLENNRNLILASRRDYQRQLDLNEETKDFDPEVIVSEVTYEHPGCYKFEDIDDADCINYGGEPEDELNRYFDDDEEDIEYQCVTTNDIKFAQEETIINEFRTIKLKSLGRFLQFPWLGPCDYYYITEDSLTFHVTEFPGKRNIPVDIWNDKLFKYLENDKIKLNEIESRNPPLEEFISESDKSDFDRQLRRLTSAGFNKPKKLLKKIRHKLKPPKTLKDLFKDIELEFSSKLDVKRQKVSSINYLPGFSGVLNDNLLKSELEAMFPKHSEIILSGQARINKGTYNHIIITIKSIYNRVRDDHKCLLIFLLSMLKDVVISDSSDSWLTDSIFNAINLVSESIDQKPNEDVYIPLAPKTGDIPKRLKHPYEGYT